MWNNDVLHPVATIKETKLKINISRLFYNDYNKINKSLNTIIKKFNKGLLS